MMNNKEYSVVDSQNATIYKFPSKEYMFVYVTPFFRSKTSKRHQNYQCKIGASKAYLMNLPCLFIKETAPPDDVGLMLGAQLIRFIRMVQVRKVAVSHFFVYDTKYLSSNKMLRSFILFYIRDILNAQVYDRKGIVPRY